MIIFSYRYPFDLWPYVFRIAVRDKRVRAFSAEERALCEKEYLALESECKETAATIQNLEADLEAAVAAASADGPWNWLSSYFSQMTIVCKSNGTLYQTDCHVLSWKKGLMLLLDSSDFLLFLLYGLLMTLVEIMQICWRMVLFPNSWIYFGTLY